jgi:hypothetical protein
MTVNGNYSTPVSVNGYRCWNCTDVANAQKHVDPQHPKAGPYGIDAANDPTLRNDPKAQPSVLFGGSLSSLKNSSSSDTGTTQDTGTQLDITA